MAAIVAIAETNGPSASAVETVDPNNLNMGSVDGAELDPSSAPIVAEADSHSFEKWLRMRVSDLGGSTIVDNLKAWLSNLGGGFKVGESMSSNLRVADYVQAEYPTGGPVNTNSTVATETTPTEEPQGPNVGIGGSLSGEITTAPGYSDWIVFQLNVTENTPGEGLNQKIFTFQFDER